MSASYLVDLGNTCQLGAPLDTTGTYWPASGAQLTGVVDMLHSDSFTNLLVAGRSMAGSGQQRVQVQTSDSTASGTFTDPTSGFSVLPTAFQSGGFIVVGSGSIAGNFIDLPLPAGAGGQPVFAQSGFILAAGFQRPHRYVRAVVLSGDLGQWIQTIGFVAQQRTTGSGGGISFQPGSGTVNV